MKQLTGAQIVLECLKEQGVDTIFGYPGGAILNIYDELYKQKKDFTHILTSHEQGASHAADGYARSTGKVGVCFATSGPGATNIVTGLATANMDSVPVVAITCNVGVSLLGKDSFQEVDISGVTIPITKHNFIVKNVEELADTIRRAFKIAKTGRPGPVLIDIPKDVTAAMTSYEPQKPEKIIRFSERIKEADIQHAIKMIRESKRPYILVGGGAVISDAADELKEFVDKVDAPVCDTLMGKGAFNGTDERYSGMLGMHGTKAANLGVSHCDLLIAIGTRFSDRVLGNPKTFAKNAKILQIDIDLSLVVHPPNLPEEHIPINHLVGKLYGQLLLLELLHIMGHPQAVPKQPYLLHALPLLLNWLQNQQQSTTPLRLLLLHLNSTMIQYI